MSKEDILVVLLVLLKVAKSATASGREEILELDIVAAIHAAADEHGIEL